MYMFTWNATIKVSTVKIESSDAKCLCVQGHKLVISRHEIRDSSSRQCSIIFFQQWVLNSGPLIC